LSNLSAKRMWVMRNRKANLAYFSGLIVIFGCGVFVPSAHAQALPATMTVGAFIQGLQSLEKSLEDSGHSLIEQGNAVVGQQQLLLAGTLQATVVQLQKAYSSSMKETFGQMDKAQSNLFENVAVSLKSAGNLEHSTSTDILRIENSTQDSIHALLDRIPLTDKSPLYFGIETRDVLQSFNAHPDDIVIRGYHLVDDRLNRKPPELVLMVSGKTYKIDPKTESAQFNRVAIALPEEVKRAIRLDNKSCEPMKLFHISGKVFYEGPWFRFDPTLHEMSFPIDADAEVGSSLYEITSEVKAVETTIQPVGATFANTSGQLNVGCEQSSSTGVNWNAPDGASQLNATAVWVETSNLKSQSATALTSGLVATASGSITGLDKGFMGNCSGGGHGKLQLSGTYMLPQAVQKDIADSKKTVIQPGSAVHMSMPSGSQIQTKHVHLVMSRLACTQQFDSVDIDVPEDQRIVQSNSEKGFFEVTIHPGQIEVTNTKMLPDLP